MEEKNKIKKFTIGEISFIIVGLFAPATTSSFGLFGLLLLSPICAYAFYNLYQQLHKTVI